MGRLGVIEPRVLVFHEELERRTGKKLQLRINQNRSTMLSIQRSSSVFKVSIHQMFLEAPDHVRSALAEFIRRTKPGRTVKTVIDHFIEENLPRLDYSHKINPKQLITEGTYHDILRLYHEINEEYFAGKLDLRITWYGRIAKKQRNQITFGLYVDSTRLVKVHRILDSPLVPAYFVKYVIYHEMLHHVCPAYVDASGRKQIHSPEFRQQEMQFREYERATEWLNHNRHQFFSGKILQGVA